MFITVSIYSTNSNSLTNFLKFFYKFKKNQVLKVKFYSIQSQRKKNFSFFSTLQSPHINKKSQEQFEYEMHTKKLKIRVSQISKFLAIWKAVKTRLFPDIKVKTQFCFRNSALDPVLLTRITSDTFRLATFFKPEVKCSQSFSSPSPTVHTFLKLLDIQGEILLKSFPISLDSSVGRAKDWKSLCRQFKPVSKQNKTLVWKTLYEIYQLI